MPDMEPKKRPLGDRNSVLKLIKRWKDFQMSEDSQVRFDKNVDPTKRDMQIKFKVSLILEVVLRWCHHAIAIVLTRCFNDIDLRFGLAIVLKCFCKITIIICTVKVHVLYWLP